VEELSTAIDNL
jgi:hypothetical protein